MVSEDEFYRLGCEWTQHNYNGGSLLVGERRFTGMFGTTALVCSIAWELVEEAAAHPVGAKFQHMLCALYFLKCYNTEHVNHAVSGFDEKTFRKWSWTYVELLASLRVVSLFVFVHLFINFANINRHKKQIGVFFSRNLPGH